MAATGADLSETYLRKMLAHHQGAVAMSDIALANGATGAVRAQIEKTRAESAAGSRDGRSHAPRRADGDARRAVASQASPPADQRPSPRLPKAAPAQPAPAKPKAAPAEPKPPAPTCLPEHRALGHC